MFNRGDFHTKIIWYSLSYDSYTSKLNKTIEHYERLKRQYEDLKRFSFYNSKIITPFNFLKNLEKAIFQFETPLGGLGTLGLWQLFSLAKEKKIPVILSGEGLDETFAGYKYYIYYY